MKLPAPRRERGVVLIITLLALLIMTIGAVALVRSMNSSLTSAGNLAFRHDLVNQSEQAIAMVTQGIRAGTLLTDTTVNNAAINYSATTLPSNAQGIPTVLLNSDSAFTSAWTAGDLTGATSDVKIRYIIDRLCSTTGLAVSSTCVQYVPQVAPGPPKPGQPLLPPSETAYRLTVRVTGPRGTQIFMQTNFTKPD